MTVIRVGDYLYPKTLEEMVEACQIAKNEKYVRIICEREWAQDISQRVIALEKVFERDRQL